LRDAQIQFGELRAELRKLRLENATLTANQPKRRSAKKVPPELLKYGEEIAALGRKFGVMMEPWVDPAAFGKPRPDVSPTDKDRYQSDLSMLQGVVAELYEFVPGRFHEMMERHSYFGNQVSRFLVSAIIDDNR
jgi:hypothetical protein